MKTIIIAIALQIIFITSIAFLFIQINRLNETDEFIRETLAPQVINNQGHLQNLFESQINILEVIK